MNTWKIAYTIVDVEHEYGDYLLHEAVHLTKAEAAAIMAAFWCGDCGPEKEARFLQELTDHGCAALPACGRCITGIRWAAVPPITVTIHNGIVEDVAGLPAGAALQVRDWDDEDRDGQGRLVPWDSLWEGPRSEWPR